MMSHVVNRKLDSLHYRIDECIFRCYTPDKPRLRYGGPINVLLIDDLGNFTNLTSLGLVDGVDFTTVSYTANTTSEFLPFIGSRDGSKSCVIPYATDWRKSIKTEIKGLAGEKPRPIQGRLYKFSLKAIEALDLAYRNGHVRRRIKVGVKTEALKQPTTSAWVYFTPESAFMRWDPHTNDYSPLSGMTLEPLMKDLNKGTYRVGYDFRTIRRQN